MKTIARKTAVLLLCSALAACGGGGSFGSSNSVPSVRHAAPASASGSRYLTNIVGIGDSLTAGYQAGGFLGALNAENPLTPGAKIPPGQESGWWSVLYEQATGFSPAAMYVPAESPLPLIAAPGLNNQVVASATTVVGTAKSGNACEYDHGFNQSAFGPNSWKRTRLATGTGHIRDLGVPGITLHEAAHMFQPLTPTCNSLPGTAGLLSAVTNGESSVFYPVLGDWIGLGPNLSMVRVANLLQPSLVTVWLGANDVLKFMGSGGQFKGGDMTPGQVQADLQPIVGGFRKNSIGVVIANLPDVLWAPYFMNSAIPKNPNLCHINQYFYCLLLDFGQQPSTAAKLSRQIASTYHLTPTGKCVPTSVSAPCGYVTLPGALSIVASYLTTGKIPSLDPTGPGSGLGANYITPAFAGEIQVVNNNVNAGIDQTAQANAIPLVDVQKIFAGIASGDPKNKYFREAQVNPGVCCTLVFLGGLLSFDGIHPSNTGYALIAQNFIEAVNRGYGTSIPNAPINKIYSGVAPYKFADPYAPQILGDLHVVRNGNQTAIQYTVPRNY